MQHHRIDRLTGPVQQRQRHFNVIARSGLMPQQGQDKRSIPMQIGLIRRLLYRFIAASQHSLQVIYLEVSKATGDQWSWGGCRLGGWFGLASTKQHASQQS